MAMNSGYRRSAQIRAQYSYEPTWAAEGGIARDYSLGFDRCTSRQHQFRALMALLLLNNPNTPRCLVEPDDHRVIMDCGVSRLMYYSVAFSAQYDDFVVLSDIPGHVLQAVIDRSKYEWTHGVPGLRRESLDKKNGWLLFRHLPTGASLRFRYCNWIHPAHKKPASVESVHFRGARCEARMTAEEEKTLKAIPQMHPDSERLLSGLVTRLWLFSKSEGWAVSGLVWNNIPWKRIDDDGYSFTYLWGDGIDWVLRWGGSGSVPVADVARALVHEQVGIEGASSFRVNANRWEVRLGAAKIVLEYRFHEGRDDCDCGEMA